MNEPLDNPLIALTQFAALLGWQDLRIVQQRLQESDELVTITWSESGKAEGLRDDFFLQINEAPSDESVAFVAAVYAIRYGICTGWHRFTLFLDSQQMSAEAANVEVWLHKRWFGSLAMRREFRRLHPESANYSWPRIREQGPPYLQENPPTA